MSDQLDFLLRNQLNFLIGFPGNRPGGLLMSLILAGVGITFGFALALIVAAAATAKNRVARWCAATFIQIFRGIPLIVLLVVIHQFVGGREILGFETSTLTSAFVALALYSAAYQADIIATGLRNVPQRLIDDARLLGASPLQVLRQVRLPYALRTMQPALTGQAITVFKDTSVVVVLGVVDLTTTARLALGADVSNAPYWVATYVSVGFIYFVVAFGLSRLAHRREQRGPHGGLIHLAPSNA